MAILYVRSRLRLVVDLQANIKAQQSTAYARKIKLSNLKEMAKTVVYVQEHGYDTREELLQHYEGLSAKLANAEASLKELTGSLRKTNEMIHYAGQYYATKAIRSAFLKSGNKKKYREQHREELAFYDEAVRYFKENAGGSIPSIKALKSEKEKLQRSIEEQKAYLSSLRKEQKEMQAAISNIDTILGEQPASERRKRRTKPER